MSDRTSHIFEGAGSTLQTTYTAAATTAVTSGYSCAEYDRINVYMTVSAIVSAGVVNCSIEYSHDGTNWFILYAPDPSVAAFGKWEQYKATPIGAAQGYYFSLPTAGAFFRVRVTYVSGTSVTISSATIEGKS
jgi:hypothetical protein